jgi:hypothetical protein
MVGILANVFLLGNSTTQHRAPCTQDGAESEYRQI